MSKCQYIIHNDIHSDIEHTEASTESFNLIYYEQCADNILNS